MVEPATSTASLRAMRKTRRSDIAKLADLESTSSPEGPGSILFQSLGGRGHAIKLKFVHDCRTRRKRPDRQVLDPPNYGGGRHEHHHQRIRQDRDRRRDLRLLAGARDLRGIRRLAPWRVTNALIEGLGEGKADLPRNGTITEAPTDGRQHPVMSLPNTIPDFAFAV